MPKFLPAKDQNLFLRYAIPCGQVLVKRGKLDEDELDRMIEDVKAQGGTQKDCEVFEVAMFWCSEAARGAGKKEVDKKIIHTYFFEEHEKAVEEAAAIHPDIKPDLCRVQEGLVMDIDEEGVLKVFLPTGMRHVRPDFVPDAKKGSKVSVHYNFACEVLG